jgi:uncharacterized membrane protein YhhN
MQRNLIAGLILILLGALFLANNLGYTSLSLGRLISTWWPAILIVVGISMLLRDRGRS